MMDGNEIRALRKQLGLSQAEFARCLGTHQVVVSNWETGHTKPHRLSIINLRDFVGSYMQPTAEMELARTPDE